MIAQTSEEFENYMTTNYEYYGLRFKQNSVKSSPFYEHPEARWFNFKLPDYAGGFAYIAGAIPAIVSENSEFAWRGGAVWYQDYDVWSQQNNVEGRTMIERIRAGYGELRPFGKATVNVFRDTDLSILPAFLLAPLIYGWDAHYIPQERGIFVSISHDGFWDVSTETDADSQRFESKVKQYGLERWLRKPTDEAQN